MNKVNELWNSVPDSGGKASWSDDGGDNGETSWTVFVPDPGGGGGGLNVTYTRNGDGTITSNVSAAGSSGILYSTTILDDVEVSSAGSPQTNWEGSGEQQSGREQFAQFLQFFYQKQLNQLNATKNIRWQIYDARLDRGGAWGGTERKPDGVVLIHISVAAMKDIKLLYHTIGHELIHAADYINGNYDRWQKILNNRWKDSVEGLLRVVYEYHAYAWDAATEKAFGTNYGAQEEFEFYKGQMEDFQLMDLIKD